jgi:thiamine-phosphate pyrophosphorylase
LRDSKHFPGHNHPFFYYVTDRKKLHGGSLIRCVRRALDWGVDVIQLREKDLTERELYDLACRIVSMARGTGCRILVNGRADVALAAGADGVHLPSAGLGVGDIRPWVPERFCIGVSVHTMKEIHRAADAGADYLMLGHVFSTPSKTDLGDPVGLDFLRKACSRVSVPIFALGGMCFEKIGPVMETGAAGIAGISLFQDREEFARLKKTPHDHHLNNPGGDFIR